MKKIFTNFMVTSTLMIGMGTLSPSIKAQVDLRDRLENSSRKQSRDENRSDGEGEREAHKRSRGPRIETANNTPINAVKDDATLIKELMADYTDEFIKAAKGYQERYAKGSQFVKRGTFFHLPVKWSTKIGGLIPTPWLTDSTDEDLQERLSGIFKELKKEGYASARASNVKISVAGNKTTAVYEADWERLKGNGIPYYKFHATYTLVKVNGQWKITSVYAEPKSLEQKDDSIFGSFFGNIFGCNN